MIPLSHALGVARRDVAKGRHTAPEVTAALLIGLGCDWFDDPLAAERCPDAADGYLVDIP